MSYYTDVVAWHLTFGVPVADEPQPLPADRDLVTAPGARTVVEWATQTGPVVTRHLSEAAAQASLAGSPDSVLVCQTVTYSGWQPVEDGATC